MSIRNGRHRDQTSSYISGPEALHFLSLPSILGNFCLIPVLLAKLVIATTGDGFAKHVPQLSKAMSVLVIFVHFFSSKSTDIGRHFVAQALLFSEALGLDFNNFCTWFCPGGRALEALACTYR